MAVRSRIADWRSWKSVSELDDDTEASYKWQSDRENAIVSLKAKKVFKFIPNGRRLDRKDKFIVQLYAAVDIVKHSFNTVSRNRSKSGKTTSATLKCELSPTGE